MSLPSRIYNVYRKVIACELVQSKNITEETIEELESYLNESIPINDAERAQKALVWSIYNSNKQSFGPYVNNTKNRISALVLYLDSVSITRNLKLMNLVYIKWDNENGQYLVSKYVANNNAISNHSNDTIYTRNTKVTIVEKPRTKSKKTVTQSASLRDITAEDAAKVIKMLDRLKNNKVEVLNRLSKLNVDEDNDAADEDTNDVVDEDTNDVVDEDTNDVDNDNDNDEEDEE